MPAERSPIDVYLARLPEDQRAALQRLRSAVHKAAPRATECISYQLPAFRLDGRGLVAFGAASAHCAFYPMSSSIVGLFKADLAAFHTSKGAIRFQPEKPLPLALIRRIVKARIAENNAAAVHSRPSRTRGK